MENTDANYTLSIESHQNSTLTWPKALPTRSMRSFLLSGKVRDILEVRRLQVLFLQLLRNVDQFLGNTYNLHENSLHSFNKYSFGTCYV